MGTVIRGDMAPATTTLEPPATAAAAPTTGLIRMRAPDGALTDVQPTEVAELEAKGWKRA